MPNIHWFQILKCDNLLKFSIYLLSTHFLPDDVICLNSCETVALGYRMFKKVTGQNIEEVHNGKTILN